MVDSRCGTGFQPLCCLGQAASLWLSTRHGRVLAAQPDGQPRLWVSRHLPPWSERGACEVPGTPWQPCVGVSCCVFISVFHSGSLGGPAEVHTDHGAAICVLINMKTTKTRLLPWFLLRPVQKVWARLHTICVLQPAQHSFSSTQHLSRRSHVPSSCSRVLGL